MPNKKLIPTVGAKFGMWTVISEETTDSTNTMWNCKCDCGETKLVAMNNLMNGKSTQCLKCAAKERGKKKRTGCGDISGDMWAQMKVTNETSLTIEEAWNLFQDQRGKCAISGMDIELHGYPFNREKTTAVLAKKNHRTYKDKNNFYWLHKDIANMKMAFTMTIDHKRFIQLIWKIVDHQAKVNKEEYEKKQKEADYKTPSEDIAREWGLL